MEEKKVEVTIDFGYGSLYDIKKMIHIKKYDYVKEKDFVFCCDLLNLKEYDEFEKKLKDKYWNYDNGIMVMDVIKQNNVKHFEYILQYITITAAYFEDIIIYCGENKLFSLIYYILDNKLVNSKYHYEIAASSSISVGSLDVIKKYSHMLKHFPQRVSNMSVLNGDIKNIQYLKKIGYRFNNTLNYIIASNNVENINWFKRNGVRILNNFNLNTIPNIKLPTMVWLIQNRNINFSVNIVSQIIRNGNINIIKLYCETFSDRLQFMRLDDITIYRQDKDKINILKYIKKFYLTIDVWTMHDAFEHNDIAYVKQLLINGYKYSENIFTAEQNQIIRNIMPEVEKTILMSNIKDYNKKYNTNGVLTFLNE